MIAGDEWDLGKRDGDSHTFAVQLAGIGMAYPKLGVARCKCWAGETRISRLQFQYTMRERCCPVCGSWYSFRVFSEADYDPTVVAAYISTARKVPKYMHYRLLCCRECDLLYASPIPSKSEMATTYDTAVFQANDVVHCSAVAYREIVSHILLPDKVGTLDIGTGDGAFLSELLRGNTSLDPAREFPCRSICARTV